MIDKEKIKKMKETAEKRIEDVHLTYFEGYDKPIFLVSEQYPGVWLEHFYDSVMYAELYPEHYDIAQNLARYFIKNQTDEGQLPCYMRDISRRKNRNPNDLIGYGEIQECVSFTKLCLMLWKQKKDKDFLNELYGACTKWEAWLRKYRMTKGKGLVEMFFGFDTGHDHSERVMGIAHEGLKKVDGVIQNAKTLPDDDGVTPIFALDMSANMYATDRALAEMAVLIGKEEESRQYLKRAKEIKENIFKYLYDEKDGFFYDADRNLNKRRIKSSTILHLFLEGVLDKEEDAELIENLKKRYLFNENEFWPAYPFPAVSLSEPSREKHKNPNSWGYYSQALIALRATMWMDEYGFSNQLDELCTKWVSGLMKNFDKTPFGQELDPETGETTGCSGYYSASMIFFLYAIRRLGL